MEKLNPIFLNKNWFKNHMVIHILDSKPKQMDG